MKKDELFQMADDICREVIKKNSDVIGQRTRDALSGCADANGKVSPGNAAAALSAVSLSLCPQLSAIITVKLLVKLGLVTLEDET